MRRTTLAFVSVASVASVALLGACQSQDSTKLVVTVWSDLAIPTEIDGIHLDIKGSGGTHPFDFKLVTKTQLPVQLALVPLGAKDEAFDVRATAELGATPVVWQDAYTAFLPSQARELTLFLGRACIGVTTCGSGLTCSNGACTQPIQVDPKSLPTYVPNRPPTPPDAAAAAPDGSAEPMDALVTEATSPGFDAGLDTDAGSAPDVPLESGRLVDAATDAVGKDGPTDLALDTPAADAPADTALDSNPSCTPSCTLGLKRCGSGGGLQTCVLVNGCAGWGPETPCTGRRSCVTDASGATCSCPTPPAGCSGGTGSFCSTTDSSLQTCLQDTDGCVYLGAATICPAQKPCTGTFPSANCSCPPAPAICANTTGTFCDGATSVVTCSHDGQGCLVSAPNKTCPARQALRRNSRQRRLHLSRRRRVRLAQPNERSVLFEQRRRHLFRRRQRLPAVRDHDLSGRKAMRRLDSECKLSVPARTCRVRERCRQELLRFGYRPVQHRRRWVYSGDDPDLFHEKHHACVFPGGVRRSLCARIQRLRQRQAEQWLRNQHHERSQSLRQLPRRMQCRRGLRKWHLHDKQVGPFRDRANLQRFWGWHVAGSKHLDFRHCSKSGRDRRTNRQCGRTAQTRAVHRQQWRAQ